MPAGQRTQRNPNQAPNSANTSGNTPPPNPLDARVLARPTPLSTCSTPGSETFSHLARQEFDDMEASLTDVVARIKQKHDNGPHAGNRFVSPEGPGMDMLNALALIAHQLQTAGQRNNTPYTPRATPSATMAQEIITAFPNPKDAALAIANHLEAVARINERNGLTLDVDHEIEHSKELLGTIYGDRYTELKAVKQEQDAAEAQRLHDEAIQQAEAARLAQLEQDLTFEGRELLLTKHRHSLDRMKRKTIRKNLRDINRAERKNDASLGRNGRFAKRAARARNRANARRQRRDRSTWLTRWAWKRLTTRAEKKATKRESMYSADNQLREARLREAASAALTRNEHYAVTVKRLSRQRIERIIRDYSLRRLRIEEKRRELMHQGIRAAEAKRRAVVLDEQDEKIITSAATQIARRQALRGGYRPHLDEDVLS